MKSRFKKYLSYIIPKIFIGLIACVFGAFLIKEYITLPILKTIFSSEQLITIIQNFLSGGIIILIYYLVYKFLENRKIQELSLKTISKDVLIGIGLGFGLITLIVIILYFLDFYKVSGFENPISLLLPLTMLVSAALLEEVVFRGIIYRILETRFGTNIALLQALFFGVVHYFNENATITSVIFVTLLGVVLSLQFTLTKKLWLPLFFHLSWNFSQVIYGTPLSGDENFKSLLIGEFNGPSLFIGSEFGLEDSFFSILFMTILAFVLYKRCVKKKKLIAYSK
ncbi:type II CAAX endopeptidase family protein [uncultured Winogradskyella sp.]|uniref:CPBP family intramembrane glutamic endopeptidase n=1 Tax=uncultured Winogradskyella sp. TaxID=395353 RepID=UPI002625787C|nr:type II CAAX endopeptidase family protein [uncultured Winogradskyella sp.]